MGYFIGGVPQAVYKQMENISSPRKLTKELEEMKIILAEILLELNSKKKKNCEKLTRKRLKKS